MYKKTKIEWTESTWNPITGCDKISDGCKNCYACKMTNRLKGMGMAKYADGFKLTVHEDVFREPLAIKKPTLFFVNSMSDMFHEGLALDTIKKIFSVMNAAHWHTFQILTKRGDILQRYAPELTWTPNIWMGVTVENHKYTGRIDNLRTVPAQVRFISFEPLLSDIGTVNLKGIDWAIVGGESGIGARPMSEEWVLNLKAQCEAQGTTFYFKQWGGVNKKKTGRILLNRTWDEMPRIAVEA